MARNSQFSHRDAKAGMRSVTRVPLPSSLVISALPP